MEKLFHPFYTTNATVYGTELGLSLAYEFILKCDGGELTVQIKEGEGSVFATL